MSTTDHETGRDRPSSRRASSGAAAPLSRVEIDLGALRHNFAAVHEQAAGEVLAVVKADAYGHGAVAVARTLEEQGRLAGLVVARLEEAVELREHGIVSRLLLLGSGLAALEARDRHEIYGLLIEHRLEVSVTSLGELRALAEEAGEGSVLGVHLKIDTGMSRAGLAPEELAEARELLSSRSQLRWVGILSHLVESEQLCLTDPEGRDDFTREQSAQFERLLATLTSKERGRLEAHLANSAATLYRPETRHRMVRVGGALYGLDLAAGVAAPKQVDLQPVMTVRAAIVQLREIASGTHVGYGRSWTARRKSIIALVPIGYGDGYPTGATGARALTAAGPAAIVGAVSMDLICLDVTGLDVAVGEPVVMLGELGGERVTAADLAQWSGSVPYEVTCRLSRRLPRSYLEDGQTE